MDKKGDEPLLQKERKHAFILCKIDGGKRENSNPLVPISSLKWYEKKFSVSHRPILHCFKQAKSKNLPKTNSNILNLIICY